ncbi:hypothetical protein DFH09DRAFT_1105992 [Mycena vulgaris]|nr:hypothetical protein DFH09DRAFT_1105992 [Mycena vulgaris]
MFPAASSDPRIPQQRGDAGLKKNGYTRSTRARGLVGACIRAAKESEAGAHTEMHGKGTGGEKRGAEIPPAEQRRNVHIDPSLAHALPRRAEKEQEHWMDTHHREQQRGAFRLDERDANRFTARTGAAGCGDIQAMRGAEREMLHPFGSGPRREQVPRRRRCRRRCLVVKLVVGGKKSGGTRINSGRVIRTPPASSAHLCFSYRTAAASLGLLGLYTRQAMPYLRLRRGLRSFWLLSSGLTLIQVKSLGPKTSGV